MKKTNRSFAVEYKNGRRKAERKPNSIWGDLDLKSVARQEHGETASFSLPEDAKDETSGGGHSSRTDGPLQPMLTAAIPQQNNASMSKEIHMADENETATETNTPNPIVAPPAPVKQRKPRTKKVAAQADPSRVVGAASDSTDATFGKTRRGRKDKAVPASSIAKSKPLSRASKTTTYAAPAAPTDAVDDMAELLRLEEDNRNLRKQLSEKLRAENADLRKRLNLA